LLGSKNPEPDRARVRYRAGDRPSGKWAPGIWDLQRAVMVLP
jgi:hypothetical protein